MISIELQLANMTLEIKYLLTKIYLGQSVKRKKLFKNENNGNNFIQLFIFSSISNLLTRFNKILYVFFRLSYKRKRV